MSDYHIDNSPKPYDREERYPYFRYFNDEITDQQLSEVDKIFMKYGKPLDVYARCFTKDGVRMVQYELNLPNSEESLPCDRNLITMWNNTIHIRYERWFTRTLGKFQTNAYIHPDVKAQLAFDIRRGMAEAIPRERWNYEIGRSVINLGVNYGR